MATTSYNPVKRAKKSVLRLNFERNSIEIPFDSELRDFFAQVEPNSAKEEDIHVLFSYFGLYWPFKTIYLNGKQVNYPQVYKSYFVRDER
jgi:hypothetical protein